MQQLPGSQYRVQFGLKGWAAVAAGMALLVAALIAVAFVAVGLLVFALPLMLVAPVLYWLVPKPKVNTRSDFAKPEPTKSTAPDVTIIDGTYREMDETDRPLKH